MTKAFYYCCILCVFLFIGTSAVASTEPYAPNEIIVKYKEGQSEEELTKSVAWRQKTDKTFIEKIRKMKEDLRLKITKEKSPEERLQNIHRIKREAGVISSRRLFQKENKLTEEIGLPKIAVIKTNGKVPLQEVITKYENLDGVEYAEKNPVLKARYIPNDTFYSSMWGLSKIKMSEAWDIAGTNVTTVAVLDTGIDYTHIDLPANIIKGPNYIADNTDPMDDEGHGTHVAGTIGAVTNNAAGVSGINQYINLMAIKVLDENGLGYTTDIALGIYYAADNDAKVINLSLGGPGSCPLYLQDAIDYAYAQGVTIIGATGQDSENPPNIDIDLDTPTSCDHVIAVASTGPTDQRSSFSGYGTGIDIAGPGGDSTICGMNIACTIASTYLNNQYSLSQGTSMATPHVAGVATLILSKNPNLTPDEVESILISTADTIDTDQPIGKRVNARAALLATIQTLSPTVTPSLTPTPTSTHVSHTVTWTTETASSSQVEYGLLDTYGYETTEEDTDPRVTNHSVTINNLLPCTTYQYRTHSRDSGDVDEVSSNQSFVTERCIGNSEVLSTNTQMLTATAGGTLNLEQATSQGITVEIPTGFTSGTGAYFQIQRLEKTPVLQSLSSPSNYTLVNPYIYQITAYEDPATAITTFDELIVMTVSYASSQISGLNESSLMLSRNGGNSWNTLSSCTVATSHNTVTCLTQNFSIFGLFGQTMTSAAPGSSNTSTNPPPCSETPPSHSPDLFQIDTTKDNATLYFAPAGAPVTSYYIAYGLDAGTNHYGTEFTYGNSTGVISHTIGKLAPGTTYYFKVRAGNECATGDWSNVKMATTLSDATNKTGDRLSAHDDRNSPAQSANSSTYTIPTEAAEASAKVTALPQAGGKEIFTFGAFGIALIFLGVLF